MNATRLVHHQTFVSTTKLASLVPQNCLGPKDDIFEEFSNICQIKAKKNKTSGDYYWMRSGVSTDISFTELQKGAFIL